MSIGLMMRAMTPMRFRIGGALALVLALSCVMAASRSKASDGAVATQKSSASEKNTIDGKKIIVPESSRAKPGDTGKRPHTNYEIRDTGGPITPPTPIGK
jgi:hypothetical protein